ncbi:MAG: glycine hydroxymethyltransferase [Gammaproteobacteria bacterium]
MSTPLQSYLESAGTGADAGAVAAVANLQQISAVNPDIARAIVHELRDQRANLKLIASENFSSLSTQAAMSNLLTDKYAEGFAHHRFYAGCDNVDDIEAIAAEEAKKLFGADHAFVQPHSGSDANLLAFWTILRTRVQVPMLDELGQTNPAALSREDWDKIRVALGNQKILSMDLYSGGHLTHGYRLNMSAQMFDVYHYGVNAETGLLDPEDLRTKLHEVKPLIFLVGYSAYPRKINFKQMRELADEVGAVLMVDMAHFAGLVAGKVFAGDFDPVAHAHVVTSTTHKTLRGPRGGIVLTCEEFAESVDKACPMMMGGPLPQMMAAKAIAFREANSDEFKAYAARVAENAAALAQAAQDEGMRVLTGGTDNHLMLIDVQPFGLTGRQAEMGLRECGFTLNRNTIPNDPQGPWYTSGLRLGTPSVTTLGMGPEEMKEIAAVAKMVLSNMKPTMVEKEGQEPFPSKAKYTLDDGVREQARARVKTLLDRFVLYPSLDLDFMIEHFG